MSDMSNSASLSEFVERIRQAAGARGLKLTERSDLIGRSFSGDSSPSTTLDVAELPSEATALQIGRYTVIFGILPDTPTLPVVRESLRRYRNQCVVARSFLSANQSLDLHLFLVGPRGSEWEQRWNSLGLYLERDDRVARKLAWLRPRDTARDDESFREFLRRTFLARPWQKDDKTIRKDQELDLEEAPVGLPRTTAEDFDRIALEGDDDRPADEIVDALIKAWERRAAI